MSIEVRQLQIVSKVESNSKDQDINSDECNSVEEIKEEILLECENLIMKILSERGER